MKIEQYAEQIAREFALMEDREMMTFPYSRETALVVFAIKCIANPNCNGSDEALSAINGRYQAFLGATDPIESIGAAIHAAIHSR